jgi:MFS family permease
MIESLGIDKKDVAKWAGLTSAVFSLSQCLTAIFWGRASDKFGRKPTILVGLNMTMITSLVWGMSTSLPMAITARAMGGAFNGNGT